MTESERLFDRALARFRARDAAGAEQILRRNLAADPDHTASLHLLGLIAGRDGRNGEAAALLARAVANGTVEQQAASGLLLAAAHQRTNRLDRAEAAYRRVLSIAPATVEARVRLGQLLRETGRVDEAIELLSAAIAANPNDAGAHSALASAYYAQGLLTEAGHSAERARDLAPNARDLAANLAVIRNAQGRYAEAAGLCRAVLAQGDDPALLNTLGIALKETGELSEATRCFEQALTLRPDFADALHNLAGVRKDQGRTDEAVELLRKLVALTPDLAAARFALCMAHLPPLYRDTDEIERRRADYEAELDTLIAYAARAPAGALAPGVGATQPFYLAYQGGNDTELQRKYGALVSRAMAGMYSAKALAGPPAPGERIRVGIVSGHIRDHSVWRLPTRGWVEGLDRSRFALFGYHTATLRDAETDRAQARFDRFVQGPMRTARWLEEIARDRPHVLIYPEIGMDPVAARLAALRLAPIQYASWGHPSTTGYPTIDFFLSSAEMEPDDGDDQYCETLVRLPGLSTTIALPPAASAPSTRQSLGWPEQAVVYWCGQSLYKYLPEHDGVYARIAARVPGARFVFLEFPGSPALTQRFRERLAPAFAIEGLNAEEFCLFLPYMAPQDFRAAMASADIVLDSIGWSGCNSLIDALAQALPVVTLPGRTMRSRHGAALLRSLGLDAFVCGDIESYIDSAVALGLDAESRVLPRTALQAMFETWRHEAPVRALERHIAAACGNHLPGQSR